MVDPGLAEGVLAVLADVSLKAAVVIAAAGFWTVAHRSASAATRHMGWTVALACVLALTVFVPFAPVWRVALPLPARPDLRSPSSPVPADVPEPSVWMAASPSESAASRPSPAIVSAMAAGRSAAPSPPPATPVPLAPALSAPSSSAGAERIAGAAVARTPFWRREGAAGVGLVIWLIGLIAVGAPLLTASLRLGRLERTAGPVRSARVRGAFAAEAAAMGVRRRVRLLAGPHGSMPMTWGMVRPVVLMPADAWTWSDARLRAVLRHELAHVVRRDALTHALGEVACVIHWFNPLVWLAARQQREDRERACDDRVLAAGATPADYASELVELARSMRPVRAAALTGMAMARARSLRGRLIAVLDDGRDRRPVSAWQAGRALILSILAVLPLACLAPARAGSNDVAVATPAAPVTGVRAASVPAVAEARRAVPPPLAPVPPEASAPPSPTRPGKAVELAAPAARRSVAESPGTRAQPDPDLTVRVLRQAVARSLGDRPMADLLKTALAASAIRSDATRAAFIEAARTIGSDNDRAGVLSAYVETGPDAAALVPVVAAAAEMRSDREIAGVLVGIAELRPVDGALRAAIVRAAEGIRSDRQRRAVLQALVEGGAG